ncbi:MAG: hypothetical protein IPK14_15725 [Blastocatellia bacterium]|nr:hypothetical protein [Blastocatellia bacterium]
MLKLEGLSEILIIYLQLLIEIRPMEIAISPDRNILCYGSRDTITVIDTDSFSVINSFNIPVPSNFDIPSLLFSPDGNLLYVGQFNAFNISVFDFRSNQLTSIFNLFFESTIQDLKLSPDGRILYIGEFIGSIVFDITTRSIIQTIERLMFHKGSCRRFSNCRQFQHRATTDGASDKSTG